LVILSRDAISSRCNLLDENDFHISRNNNNNNFCITSSLEYFAPIKNLFFQRHSIPRAEETQRNATQRNPARTNKNTMKQSNNTNKHSTMHQPLFRFRLLAVMVLVVAVATTTTNGLFCSAFATTTSSRPLSVSLLSLGHTHRDSFFLQRSSRVSSQLRLKSDGLTPEERDAKIEKATKAMTAFTNSYLKNTDTKLCSEKSIPAVVIKGLAEHKVDLGAPLCPCRFYEDKEKEVKDGYWNCPCVPMREEKVCHCMLFLTEDNAFAGDCQVR